MPRNQASEGQRLQRGVAAAKSVVANVVDSLDDEYSHLVVLDLWSGHGDWAMAVLQHTYFLEEQVALAKEKGQEEQPPDPIQMHYAGTDTREWATALTKHRLAEFVKAKMEAKEIRFEPELEMDMPPQKQPGDWDNLLHEIQSKVKTFKVKNDGSLVVPSPNSFRPSSPEIKEALQEYAKKAKELGPAGVFREGNPRAACQKKAKAQPKKAALSRTAAEHVAQQKIY